MTLDEAIGRYKNNAEYERTHGNLQGCLEFRQLGEWLKALKQYIDCTRWVPVSERLPEVDGKYLTTIKVFGSNYNEIRSFANSLYKIDKYDFSDKKGHGWYFYDSEYGYIEETNVIAWMPLPEPMKVGEENC